MGAALMTGGSWSGHPLFLKFLLFQFPAVSEDLAVNSEFVNVGVDGVVAVVVANDSNFLILTIK
ncbi:MAG: hypothetical protein Q7J01_01515 [Syntrophales bacterium]|nr:hypothetical protein [Syntrophales bacterium]